MARVVIIKLREALNTCYLNNFHPFKSLKRPTKHCKIFNTIILADTRLSDLRNLLIYESTYLTNPYVKPNFQLKIYEEINFEIVEEETRKIGASFNLKLLAL